MRWAGEDNSKKIKQLNEKFVRISQFARNAATKQSALAVFFPTYPIIFQSCLFDVFIQKLEQGPAYACYFSYS